MLLFIIIQILSLYLLFPKFLNYSFNTNLKKLLKIHNSLTLKKEEKIQNLLIFLFQV